MHKQGTVILISFLFCLLQQSQAQEKAIDSIAPPMDSTRFIQIIKADVFRRVKQDSTGDLNLLIGTPRKYQFPQNIGKSNPTIRKCLLPQLWCVITYNN